ncbi:hypothetical protein [Streptomyces cyaneofuscatus]
MGEGQPRAEPSDHPTAVKDAANPLVRPYDARRTGERVARPGIPAPDDG